MSVAAIIVGIDNWQKYTLPLISSLYAYQEDCTVVVVDNASTPPYALCSEDEYNQFVLHRTERLCYSAAINQGKRVLDELGSFDHYIVLSNDVLCTGPFAHMLAPQGDVVAGPLLCTNQGWTYIEGWCVCTTPAVWGALGGWDEKFQISSWEDVDFSVSANEHGFPLVPMPELPFVHLDQRQRFTIVPNYQESEWHNLRYFMDKHDGVPA